MTTQPAPYPYFIGIDYNNSFFASGSSGSLSQAQADARYLIKIETDNASSLETFSGGIATENIDTSLLTQDLNIGNSDNRTADIYIGAGPGSTGYINIGGASSNVVLSGSIYAGNVSTTPITLNGVVIASSLKTNNLDSQTGALVIGQNSTATTSTTIGSSTQPVTIQGNTITLNNPLTLANQIPTPASNQLGSLFCSPVITWNTAQNGILGTSTTLDIGVYHFDFSVSINGTFAMNMIYITVPSGVIWRAPFVQTATTPQIISVCCGSFTFNSTIPQTTSLYVFNANTNTINYGTWNIYRVA